jgi:hypothetical protein
MEDVSELKVDVLLVLDRGGLVEIWMEEVVVA